MVGLAAPEAPPQLTALVIEDNEGKFSLIEHLLHSASVQVVGRLATVAEVIAELGLYKSEGSGLLAKAKIFFVDGNLGHASSNGRDGDKIIRLLANNGIAYPAAGLMASRGRYPAQLPGVVFGCSLDPGDDAYAEAVTGYNLDTGLGMAHAATELARMVSVAIDLLPASA